jgi:hypothetical protein
MRAVHRRSLIFLALLGGMALILFSTSPAFASVAAKAKAVQASQPSLRSMLSDSTPHVAVRFLKKKFKIWSVAESANFRFYHNQPRKLVQEVADVAEHTRLVMAKKWFGEVPDQWDPKCIVYMHADRASYTLSTKDGGKSEGCTLVRLDGLEVGSRRIHLHCDADNLLTEIVPHEVTHAVMGGNFGSHQTPRWADEGMAILSQPPASIRHYLRLLRIYQRRHDLFSTDVLMQTDDITQQNTLEYYCQSVSLVKFLVSKHGPRTFTKFIWDSFKTDYEKSLKKHYGIASFDELQKQWQAYAFAKTPPSETHRSEKPAQAADKDTHRN